MFVGFMESIPCVPGLVQHREAKFDGSLDRGKNTWIQALVCQKHQNMEWSSNTVHTAEKHEGHSDHFEEVVKRWNNIE